MLSLYSIFANTQIIYIHIIAIFRNRVVSTSYSISVKLSKPVKLFDACLCLYLPLVNS